MDLFKHFECLSGHGDALNSRTFELKNWDCVVWIGPGECRGVVWCRVCVFWLILFLYGYFKIV